MPCRPAPTRNELKLFTSSIITLQVRAMPVTAGVRSSCFSLIFWIVGHPIFSMNWRKSVLLGLAVVIYPFGLVSLARAQDQSASTTPVSTGGNSTNSTSGSAPTTSAQTGNFTPPTPEAVDAIQQQRQQLTQQLGQQLQTASPDDKVALIAAFRAQADALTAPMQPPPLSADQQAPATSRSSKPRNRRSSNATCRCAGGFCCDARASAIYHSTQRRHARPENRVDRPSAATCRSAGSGNGRKSRRVRQRKLVGG